jgi:hypothetical protein
VSRIYTPIDETSFGPRFHGEHPFPPFGWSPEGDSSHRGGTLFGRHAVVQFSTGDSGTQFYRR